MMPTRSRAGCDGAGGPAGFGMASVSLSFQSWLHGAGHLATPRPATGYRTALISIAAPAAPGRAALQSAECG